jgi:hypothetical protein
MYQNYAMRPRIAEYGATVKFMRNAGYTFLTMVDLVRTLRSGRALPDRVCIIRNDVDTDPATALAMREEEVNEGATSTYYFRLSTANREVIRKIQQSGSEVGYHFEELATVAKRLKLRNRKEVLEHMALIKSEFRNNFKYFCDICGSAPKTIASHGDFYNRRLNMANTDLIDQELRFELHLEAEAYDPELESVIDARIIDRELPQKWYPEPPESAAGRGAHVVRVLVHPRQWRSCWTENLREDLLRLWEGARLGPEASNRRVY